MNKQENAETRLYRHQQVQHYINKVGHQCVMCGRYATDTHELIYRSGTLNNPEARRLTFQKELIARLCSGCHSKAHTESATLQLLHYNIKIWGYEAVENALQAVQDQLRGKLSVEMPERESNG